MKSLTIIFLFTFSFSVCAQQSKFIRIYNLTGKKIYSGHVFATTDSSLSLKGKEQNIAIREIGYIKTKRSAANNLIIGTLTGATAVGIAGAASAEPDVYWFSYTAGEGALVGFILGLPVGAALGALTIPFKKSKTYLVNGEIIKWKEIQSVFSKEVKKSK